VVTAAGRYTAIVKYTVTGVVVVTQIAAVLYYYYDNNDNIENDIMLVEQSNVCVTTCRPAGASFVRIILF